MNKKIVTVPLVTGIIGGVLFAEARDKGKPHANFLSVSPGTTTMNVVVMDSGASTSFSSEGIFWKHNPETMGIEWLTPQDHLVVRPATLVTSPKKS
jgi:hypothetical protein